MSAKYVVSSSVIALCLLAVLGTVGFFALRDDSGATKNDQVRPPVVSSSNATPRVTVGEDAILVERRSPETTTGTTESVAAPSLSVGAIRGQVLSVLGAPVEGIEVEMHARPVDRADFRFSPEVEQEEQSSRTDQQPGPGPSDQLTARTRADGSFHISELRPGAYSVLTSGGGYQPRWIDTVEVYPDEITELIIELDKGLGLAGIVVDPGGSPVPGARILITDAEILVSGSLSLSSAPSGWSKKLRERILTVTDAAGRFRLSGLPRAIHALVVDHPDWAPAVIEIVAGSRELRIELGASATYGGVVLDSEDQTIAGAKIHTEIGYHEKVRRTATTDEEGRFTLFGLPPGAHELKVSAPGFVSESFEFEVAAGETWDDAQVTLSKSSSAVGWVVDPGEVPVAGARLSAGPSEGKFDSVVECRSDPEGRFELSGLRPDESYRILATHARFASSFVATFTAAEGQVDLGRITMVGGAFVTGRVTRASNLPVARAEVTLKRVGPSEPGAARSRMVRTDAEGTFRITGVVPGQYRLLVTAAGLVRQEHQVLVGVDDRELIVDAHFEEGLAMTGVVVEEAGRPVPGVRVELKEGHHTVGYTLTDADGTFQLSGLTDGKYMVFATKEHFSSAYSAEVSAWSSPIELTVKRKGTLAGFVRDAKTGAPVEAFLLQVPEGPGFDLQLRSATHPFHDPQGRFTLSALDEGKYTVQIKAPAMPSTRRREFECVRGK